MLLVLAIGCLAGAGFLVAELRPRPRGSVAPQFPAPRRTAARASTRRQPVVPASAPCSRLAGRVAHTVLRLSPKTTVEAVTLKLVSAGMTVSATTFLAIKGCSAAGGFVFGLVLGGSAGGPGTAILMGLILAALGWIAPEYIVSAKARTRREHIRAAMPDALDLLAVSVEAGLGFDASISKITEHMEGPLSDEFALTLGEMRVGEGRADALKKLEQRVGAPELSSFVRAIIQADQLGISLGRILRVQATDTRNRRQAAAEERAMKAPIKMLFPTVLFIFPSMFIVILVLASSTS